LFHREKSPTRISDREAVLRTNKFHGSIRQYRRIYFLSCCVSSANFRSNILLFHFL